MPVRGALVGVLSEFCSGAASEAWGVGMIEFGGFFTRVGFLLAALAQHPDDYADEGESERDANSAADDETDVG